MCTMLRYYCNATVHNHALPSCYSQTIRWKTVRSTSKLQFIEQKSRMATKEWHLILYSEKQWGHHQNYNFLNRKVVWPRNQVCRQMRKNKAWRQLKHGVKKLGQHQQYNLSPFVRTSLYFHLSCRTNFLLLWPKEIYSMISKWRAK